MIRVLIVDDSEVVQNYLYQLLSTDPEIQVVGAAASGFEAIELTKFHEPDVITMDINMDGMDGYEATRRIMETVPTPIIIVSGNNAILEEGNIFKSLEAGAIAVVHRPPGFEHPEFSAMKEELIQTIKIISRVRNTRLFLPVGSEQKAAFKLVQKRENYLSRIQVIAIGASTGGPIALQKIFSGLPAGLPLPVLFVQHIAPGFSQALLQWLSHTSGIQLKIAVEGELITKGIGYLAPDHYHMGISMERKIKLSNKPSENGLKTSINHLFRSVAETIGPDAFGVLLTGDGKDGVDALKIMRDKGAVTLVQNEESSVVFDMPGEAIKIGAADLAVSLEGIVEILVKAGSKNYA
jgi:two-component system chemotaxis response regulator CheB